MTDKITEARERIAEVDSAGWGFAAEYIEEHDARIAAEERAEADAVSLLRVIADIRAASGVGDRPMLSELAGEIGALVKSVSATQGASRGRADILADLRAGRGFATSGAEAQWISDDAAGVYDEHAAELASALEVPEIKALAEAAQAVADRWGGPQWAGRVENLRHTGEYIDAMIAALAALKGGDT